MVESVVVVLYIAYHRCAQEREQHAGSHVDTQRVAKDVHHKPHDSAYQHHAYGRNDRWNGQEKEDIDKGLTHPHQLQVADEQNL